MLARIIRNKPFSFGSPKFIAFFYFSALLPISEEVRSRLHAENSVSTFLKTSTVRRRSTKSSDEQSSARISIVITPASSPTKEHGGDFIWPAECHNLLLDPGILDDTQTQALLFVLLVSYAIYLNAVPFENRLTTLNLESTTTD